MAKGENFSMSKNNENNPYVLSVPITPKLVGKKQIAKINLTSASADLTVPGLVFPHKVKITGVKLLNGANIAASDTDWAIIQLMNGSTEVAECDTRAAHEGAVTANTSYPLNIITAEEIQDAAAVLKAVYNETDSGTSIALTNAVLQIEYYQLPEDGDFAVMHVTKKSYLKSARVMVGTTIAASDTDYLGLSLKIGSTEVAELDSRAAHENGLVALTSKAMNVVSAQNPIAAGSDLKLAVDVHADVLVDELMLLLEFYPV
jgi:hypothetical protein